MRSSSCPWLAPRWTVPALALGRGVPPHDPRQRSVHRVLRAHLETFLAQRAEEGERCRCRRGALRDRQHLAAHRRHGVPGPRGVPGIFGPERGRRMSRRSRRALARAHGGLRASMRRVRRWHRVRREHRSRRDLAVLAGLLGGGSGRLSRRRCLHPRRHRGRLCTDRRCLRALSVPLRPVTRGAACWMACRALLKKKATRVTDQPSRDDLTIRPCHRGVAAVSRARP